MISGVLFTPNECPKATGDHKTQLDLLTLKTYTLISGKKTKDKKPKDFILRKINRKISFGSFDKNRKKCITGK